MSVRWIDVSEDGRPLIDWEQAIDNAMAFDAGDRGQDASLGKLITMVQRMAFERGFEAGINTKSSQEHLLLLTMGNA